MADIDQTVLNLLARMDALEAENQTLRGELAAVRAVVVSGPAAPLPAAPAEAEPLSRRRVLQRGLQLAAASAVAGVVLTREASPALADPDHTSTMFHEDNGSWAVYGLGIDGESGSEGVIGSGRIGVEGFSSTSGYGAVYGVHNGSTGYGVVGEGTGSGAGVQGQNNAGDGIKGIGKVGVRAVSNTSQGYGAVIQGGKAQLRIVPKATAGKPTSGTHSKGELYLDSTGTIFICSAPGTPGTWRKVSTTLA